MFCKLLHGPSFWRKWRRIGHYWMIYTNGCAICTKCDRYYYLREYDEIRDKGELPER